MNDRPQRAFEPALSRVDLGTALALAALSLAWFSLTWSHTLDLRDEGYLLSRSLQVAEGAIPHRDFIDVYGPLGLLASGGVLNLSDGQIWPLRVAIGLLKCIAVVLAYGLARMLVPRSFAVFAAILAMIFWGRLAANLNTPYPSLVTITLCLASSLAVTVGFVRRSKTTLLLAGALAGLGILFKQSLGIMNVYGLLLALWGMGLFEEVPARTAVRLPTERTDAWIAVGLWWLAGLLALVPVVAFLGAVDYLLHFLLLHVTLGLLGASVLSRSEFAFPGPLITDRLLPFGLGALAVVSVVGLIYAGWGSLGQMLHDMFVIPRSYQDYYQPVVLPRASISLLSVGLLLLVTAGLGWLRDRRRRAALAAGCGLAVVGVGLYAVSVGSPQLFSREGLLLAPLTFDSALAFISSAAAMAFVIPALTRGQGGPEQRRALRALPLLFAQLMLAYQVFPRAGQNLWTIHGMLPVLLVLGLHRWADPERFASPRRVRAWAACALVALVPVWWVSPVVHAVVEPTFRRALTLPPARGISISGQEYHEYGIASVEKLVSHLAMLEPRDAPLLVLTNEEMIRFASGRPHLFPDHEFHLFLAGWGLIPKSMLFEVDGAEMLEQLRAEPDAIVVRHGDATSRNLRRAIPRIFGEIERGYRVTERFGPYRVLRSRAHLDAQ